MSNCKKTDEDWRQQLNDEEFTICRKKGTERAFTGKYWDCKAAGKYHCTCCGEPLFDSQTKYDSGSGWPSFYQSLNEEAIVEELDVGQGMTRTEVMCQHCGSHLGHKFEDGPEPTGLRYCINSVSLSLKEG